MPFEGNLPVSQLFVKQANKKRPVEVARRGVPSMIGGCYFAAPASVFAPSFPATWLLVNVTMP